MTLKTKQNNNNNNHGPKTLSVMLSEKVVKPPHTGTVYLDEGKVGDKSLGMGINLVPKGINKFGNWMIDPEKQLLCLNFLFSPYLLNLCFPLICLLPPAATRLFSPSPFNWEAVKPQESSLPAVSTHRFFEEVVVSLPLTALRMAKGGCDTDPSHASMAYSSVSS